MKYDIKNRWDGKIIYADEAESFSLLLQAAVKAGANLSWANLSGADLSRANLYGFFSFGPGGSRNAYTWARWEDGGYMVHCGCKTLELSEFKKLVAKTHGKTYHAQWYLANIKTMGVVAKASKADWEKYQKEKKS